ncbi:MAG TPA: hypothetical protein VGD49_00810 [Longimicrobiales bacterium]
MDARVIKRFLRVLHAGQEAVALATLEINAGRAYRIDGEHAGLGPRLQH